jgi:hypothetical protein
MDEYKSLQEWIQSFLVPTLSLRVARQKRRFSGSPRL